MGLVFLAMQLSLNRIVAVKILHASSGYGDSLQALHREARLLASLSHPHIVTIHDEDFQYLFTCCAGRVAADKQLAPLRRAGILALVRRTRPLRLSTGMGGGVATHSVKGPLSPGCLSTILTGMASSKAGLGDAIAGGSNLRASSVKLSSS